MKLTPYWWDDAPRPTIDNRPLPETADVAIVGAGYTGLNAARVLARAGRSVVVLEAEDAAWGCSARNGGQISSGVKPGVSDLESQFGREGGRAVLQEGLNSLNFTVDLVKQEKIDCDLKQNGRFIGAHRPNRYDSMAENFETLNKVVPFEWHMVPRNDMHRELGTEAYHGGAVLPHHAVLHPAKFANGLTVLALRAGARIETHTPVLGLDPAKGGTSVVTTRGKVLARDVIVATNGYTSRLTPGLRRRVIPIGSYIITTEPVAPDVMKKIMPQQRALSDSRKMIYYYRSSPDHTRIVFGGRVALKETDPEVNAPRLHKVMTGIFPELAETRISHSWMGFVAYTFDHLPHIGRRDGVWFSMGYCGSGVAWASYMGHKLAHKVLGNPEGATAFDNARFPTRPFYTGDPWFLGAAVACYRAMDKWGN
ncbi:MAG: FAD-binding oxidoreductase [Rhodospirillales bacterium]|nr:FAD-binding oxidoreductase [Rhodospirillales bacterium]